MGGEKGIMEGREERERRSEREEQGSGKEGEGALLVPFEQKSCTQACKYGYHIPENTYETQL
jgi:hypothetical protein